MPKYRIDFHVHCDCDPIDVLTYTPYDVIDRAVEHGIHALAITPHMIPFCDPEASDYAKKRGLLLIPGVEKLVDGKEVLIFNVLPSDIPTPCTFEDLKKIKYSKGEENILIVAPHPFYPHPKCVGSLLDEHRDVFDAVEYSHFHFFGWNPNHKAVAWAQANSKAVIANSDAHRLDMIGKNYTLVDAEELTAPSIFKAIKSRQTQIHAPALNLEHLVLFTFGVIAAQEIAHRFFPKIKAKNER